MNIKKILFAFLSIAVTAQAADPVVTKTPTAIPWNQIGAKAGADYKGDGLAVTPTESGARLHCLFQRLDAEATPEGLRLTSIAANTVNDHFRITAAAVGRKSANSRLAETGDVTINGQTVRFNRPGLTEEYTVSMDGVRQDFIVERAPAQSPGELTVKLAVTGAQVEPAADGARLVLEKSGRKIAYSRLRATDATGKELPARIEICNADYETRSAYFGDNANPFGEPSYLTPGDAKLAIVVNDADAIYPIRIDPTFSDANWISVGDFPNVNDQVFAALTDGKGNLYIGGEFTAIGHVAANDIAMWNGINWTPLGSGISGGGGAATAPGVQALALSGNTLYAGGSFTTAGGIAVTNIAQWNGTNWSALGSGISGGLVIQQPPVVLALAVSGGNLYVGGAFINAGGILASNIAQWNGSSWSALGSGMIGGKNEDEFYYDSGVYALAVSGSTLYAGGYFTNAGGVPANSIAQWNGNNWSALGSGITGTTSIGFGPDVRTLLVSGSTLYVGGGFTFAGGNSANSIAQWSNSTWSPLGSGINFSVSALALSGSNLYVGGDFLTAGGIAATNVAQWNGTNWSALGWGGNASTTTPVFAFATSGNILYAGGSFADAGGILVSNLAQWNGTNWSGVSPAIDEYVNAFTVSGGTVYAGGVCSAGAGKGSDYVAQWTGSNWVQLGPSFNGAVQALAVSSNTLYAGGQFTSSFPTNFQYVAQWNGTNWTRVGPINVITGSVNALLASGGVLYAGGAFTVAGGGNANNIAGWNGTHWSALGSGFNNSVNALAVSGNTLYAGGSFTQAGAVATLYIAQWNGTNWAAVGAVPGLNNTVNALLASGNTLYAGGAFTFDEAEGISLPYIAQWNGNTWSPLGSGVNGAVSALALSGNTLYAGGSFADAGGKEANFAAQWNGINWAALGSGLNNTVNALAISGNTLFVGGEFTTAGTNYSYYTARAVLPLSVSILNTDGNFGFTNGNFGFDISGPTGSNVVIQASTDLQTWTPLQTNLLGNGPLYFSDSQTPTGPKRFYRVQLSP